MAKNTTNTNTNKETKVFNATLNSAYIMARSDKDPVPRCTLNIDPEPDAWKDIDAFYEGVTAKFVPQWAKDKDHMMLRSTYDVPVKLPDGSKVTFQEFVDRGLIDGAKISVKVTFSPETDNAGAAIYPAAVRIFEDGVEKDPFEGM